MGGTKKKSQKRVSTLKPVRLEVHLNIFTKVVFGLTSNKVGMTPSPTTKTMRKGTDTVSIKQDSGIPLFSLFCFIEFRSTSI